MNGGPPGQAGREAVASAFAPARGLEQEPRAPLRLIDPVLDQARARHVAVLVAQVMGLAQPRGQLFVILAQFSNKTTRSGA
jgi:hypothetical protein